MKTTVPFSITFSPAGGTAAVIPGHLKTRDKETLRSIVSSWGFLLNESGKRNVPHSAAQLAALIREYSCHARSVAEATFLEALAAAARTTPEAMAAKMTAGLEEGKADKDGEGVQATLKELGIKDTYKAIRAYLATPDASQENPEQEQQQQQQQQQQESAPPAQPSELRTLKVTETSHGFSVAICEEAPDGGRDAFETIECYCERGELDTALGLIAAERGLSYPAAAAAPVKSVVEVLKASDYYGRPTPGYVRLVNGSPWHFAAREEAERLACFEAENPEQEQEQQEVAKDGPAPAYPQYATEAGRLAAEEGRAESARNDLNDAMVSAEGPVHTYDFTALDGMRNFGWRAQFPNGHWTGWHKGFHSETDARKSAERALA